MNYLLLSKSTTPIIGWIATLLGWLMNGIYNVLSAIGIENIGLAIIFFTIIVYVAMTPLQIRQQKMSKVMNLIQPELNKLQKKYEGKRDQASQMKMNEEMQDLYARYGVSPTGSCLPLLIQMPILFALYAVIYHIPGYITKVRNLFDGLATNIMATDGYSKVLTDFVSDNNIRLQQAADPLTKNNVIDILYLLKPSQWTKLSGLDILSSLKDQIASVATQSQRVNSFLGINISESPWDAIRAGFKSIAAGDATGMVILALVIGILIPFLAWFTQWFNYKLMPQADSGEGSTAATMKSMNIIMPIFSAYICMTLSMGIGIYWIVGAVIRSIQQAIINNRLKDMDPDKLMEQARDKYEAKREKQEKRRKDYTTNIAATARTNVKSIKDPRFNMDKVQDVDYYEKSKEAPADSIMAKANMVRRYDEEKLEKKNRNKNRNRKNRDRRRQQNSSAGSEVKTAETEKVSETAEAEKTAETEGTAETEKTVDTAEAAETETAAATAEATETKNAGTDAAKSDAPDDGTAEAGASEGSSDMQ